MSLRLWRQPNGSRQELKARPDTFLRLPAKRSQQRSNVKTKSTSRCRASGCEERTKMNIEILEDGHMTSVQTGWLNSRTLEDVPTKEAMAVVDASVNELP